MKTMHRRLWMLMLSALLLLGLAAPVRAEEGSETATLALRNGGSYQAEDVIHILGVQTVLAAAGKVTRGEAPEGIEGAEAYYDENQQLLYLFSEAKGQVVYPKAHETIHVDLTEELRGKIQTYLNERRETFGPDLTKALEDFMERYQAVELTFAPIHHLTVKAQGPGGFVYAEGEEPLSYEGSVFEDYASPVEQAYQFGAKAEEGARFVKWILNGEDYSKEAEINVTLAEEDLELVAVFKANPYYEGILTLQNGASAQSYPVQESLGVLTALAAAGKVNRGQAPEGMEEMEGLQFYYNEAGALLFLYNEENNGYFYGPAAVGEEGQPVSIKAEITEEAREKLQLYLDILLTEIVDEEYKETVQAVIDDWKSAEMIFAPLTHLQIETQGDGKFACAWNQDELDYGDLAQNYYTTYQAGSQGRRGIPVRKVGEEL